VLHDFSDDAEALRARIEQSRVKLAGPTFGEIDDMAREMETLIASFENMQLKPEVIDRLLNNERRAHEAADEQRTRNTLNLLEGLGDHLAGIPGRKSIVWFGNGISMLSIVGSLEKDIAGSHRSHEELVRNTSRRLAQQGVTMYMFDARGMQVQSAMSVETRKAITGRGQVNRYERLQANATISADTLPAMSLIADITGGRFYWNTNDVGRAVDEIAADSEGTYSLGFYADGEPDDKWHNLDLRVTRKGVKLQYRDGYMSAMPPNEPLDWSEDQWRAAVYNPVGSTAVQLDARLQLDDAKTVSMTMQISTDNLHFRQVDGQDIDVLHFYFYPDHHSRIGDDRNFFRLSPSA
jgi:VWFA-related protein